MTRYYKTTFTIDVLSEEPLGDCLSLGQIDYAITDGDCVGSNLRQVEAELTSKEMAQALLEAGSEPDFFMLDDDGNPTTEEVNDQS
jgi:hypothetical protein